MPAVPRKELERTLNAGKDAERTASKITEGKGINSPDQEGRAQAHQNRTQRQNRTNEEKQTTERQKERHNTHKNGDRRRQEQKEEGEEKGRSDKTSEQEPTPTDHQPNEGTWSPTKPVLPLTDQGERLRIARAFSR